jgi:phenylacetic acid degradation operon negative regulatory protein
LDIKRCDRTFSCRIIQVPSGRVPCMDCKTEQFLYMLLWTAEALSRPGWRNLDESFESWAYRRGLQRQLRRLEQQQFLETQAERPGDRVHRLSEAGRLLALGGRDPVACWNRRWDGRWHLVLFDVPERRRVTRNKLRHYLRSRGFGYLQNSVWITPDPIHEERALLEDGPVNVESLLMLEARPCAGETDAEIVAGAWDFHEINQRYAAHGEILARRPRRKLESQATAATFHRWLQLEHETWHHAMGCDPLLPQVLLPPDYAGQKAWAERLNAMAKAGEQMRAFRAGRISGTISDAVASCNVPVAGSC